MNKNAYKFLSLKNKDVFTNVSEISQSGFENNLKMLCKKYRKESMGKIPLQKRLGKPVKIVCPNCQNF